MKMRRHFLLFSCFAMVALVHAQNQTGFISLDCGLPQGLSYNETTTGLNYTSDMRYIQADGISNRLAAEFNSGMPSQQQVFEHVRSFPEGDRNCYMVNLKKGDKYLVRASFMYGNYDAKNETPEFDLHLGPNLWENLVFQNASAVIVKELIHLLQSNYLHICLVNTGKGIPFISGLELRLLSNSTYNTQSATESLETFSRNDFGSTSNSPFRFPEDVYDRIWQPYQRNDLGQISSNSSTTSNSNYLPPSLAMRTASTPANASQFLNFSIQDISDSNAQFYFYMHLAELEQLQANESREYNIYLNNLLWYQSFSPTYLRADTLYTPAPVKGGQFSMEKTRTSTHPPILNAFEAYKVKLLVLSQTVEKDVDAIMNIKSMYGIKRNWQGDPCAPQQYTWEGLNCSYEDSNPPRIISFNLSSSGLRGEIAPYIVNLTQLLYLDLSNNNLTGPVPDFLTNLQSLTLLNLERNALNGSVPAGLIDKSNRGLLQLNVEGNQIPCTWESCTTTTAKKKKKSVVVPVSASVAAVLSVLIIVLALLWWFKRIKPLGNMSTRKPYKNEVKSRHFSYSDVLRITNNFERVIGKGGFGTVYHGFIADTEVAVKMLSKSSIQGYQQFEAEVELLLRVHHRNLTSLIGYCDDGTNMGLIYEYMAKGNLLEYLSASSSSVLNWEERLRIALEAAQGLEYLHHGCKPPIIHRDVKSTNILLTENMQAKLSDFGLSKTFDGGSHISTVVAGTPGYLDPEYSTTNRLTEKSDVYSFGVVLLEIITNRPVIARTTDEPTHISNWVGSMLANGDIENIVDSKLKGEFEINSGWKAIELGMACVTPASSKRPTMNSVVMELSECLLAEIKRTRGSLVNEDESMESIGMVSLNFSSEISPLAR